MSELENKSGINIASDIDKAVEEMAEMLQKWPTKNVAAIANIKGEPFEIGSKNVLQQNMVWASVTKLLASYALLIAHEEKSIDISADINEVYLSGYNLKGNIKLLHLMSHTSGLPFDGKEAVIEPEKRRIYSNGGFNLISKYFSDYTGFPFVDYLNEALFEPLNMKSFSLKGDQSIAKDAVGSIDDMSLFLNELIEPTLIQGETLTWATQNWFPNLRGILPGFNKYEDNGWGLGFEVKTSKSPHWMPPSSSSHTYGHFGKSGSFLWVNPDVGIGLISCCDSIFDTWAHELWPSFSDKLFL